MNVFNLMLGINLIAVYCLLVGLVLNWIMKHEPTAYWLFAYLIVALNGLVFLGWAIFPALEKYLPL